jgi:aquaporin Z
MDFKALLAEFLGTFFFLSIILNSVFLGDFAPIAIAIGLLAAIYFGGKVSGGHYNPAVSVMMFVKGKIAGDLAILYISAQVLGGLMALMVNNVFFP